MGNDQERDAQAERQLQRLQRGPAELPALVQRPDAEAGMDQRRAVERDRHGQKLPEQRVVIDTLRHRIERDVAERLIEEMAAQIAEQPQATGEADLPLADATEEGPDLLEKGWGCAVHIIIIGDRCDPFQREKDRTLTPP